MGRLIRQNRVIVATGGSCPALERLSNGDLIVAYRDDTARGKGLDAAAWNSLSVSVTRSTDGGNTWQKEHRFSEGAGPGDTAGFYGHHGLAQLKDGTILLPYMANLGGEGVRKIILRKSTDQGHTWSDPIQVIRDQGAAKTGIGRPPTGRSVSTRTAR